MIKIVSIALICALIVLYLKSINSDFFFIAIIVSGLILISISLPYLSTTFDFISKISSLINIDNQLFKILLKITAIGYIVEFGASIINDFGLKSLADKLVFVGKLAIFTISIPVFYSIINLLMELLK